MLVSGAVLARNRSVPLTRIDLRHNGLIGRGGRTRTSNSAGRNWRWLRISPTLTRDAS